ncbi:YER079W [Saccharomyces arboricola H-6]|uniref:YER079W n=1 Tax=Saccharomyces arboricola (strain H-6 / AS 2.3317 / CBS 10644) TaxID=1160507 RepID=J8PPA7_SACAR|nr:YER079W [Saccharomyces arboricola H-6]
MPDSSHSISSKDIASAISLYDQSIYTNNRSTNLDLDQRSISPSNIVYGDDRITRTNSGGSITSGASMIATKDGIQGSNIKRDGIPKYSLNLLNSMVRRQYDHNNSTKSPTPNGNNNVDLKKKNKNKKKNKSKNNGEDDTHAVAHDPSEMLYKLKTTSVSNSNLTSESTTSLSDQFYFQTNNTDSAPSNNGNYPPPDHSPSLNSMDNTTKNSSNAHT